MSGIDRRIVLDTSAYSHLRRGHRGLIEMMVAADLVGLPTIVLGELHAAFRAGSRLAANMRGLQELLDRPFVRVQPVDEAVAEQYGHIVPILRRAGTPLPANDIWIAATARANECRVVTFDTHFRLIPNLAATVFDVPAT